MSDQGQAGMEQIDAGRVCPDCGARHPTGDRFCAECGAALSPPRDTVGALDPAPTVAATTAIAPDAASLTPPAPRDGSLWVLGAAPSAVIGGGFLLLLLAAALLFIGQRDTTGTIVMLSICITPLALLVMVVGIARAIIGAAHRG